MSKAKPKCKYLPKLQSKILMCLAKHGSLIVSEINTRIKGEYTSTNRAIHELEDKGVAVKVGFHEYRNRRFSKYWLADLGVSYAILCDANPNVLLRHIEKIFPDDVEQAVLVDLATIDKELFKTAFSLTQETPKADLSTAMALSIYTLSKRFTKKQAGEKLEQLAKVLRKHPKYYAAFPAALEAAENDIRELRMKYRSLKGGENHE